MCLFVKFQEQSGRFKEIEDRALAAEQQLQEYTSSWEDQKKAKAAETKKLEARCADLVNQNSTLHSQLEKVGIDLSQPMLKQKILPILSSARLDGQALCSPGTQNGCCVIKVYSFTIRKAT